MAAALPGRTGLSSDGDPGAMVGRVPARQQAEKPRPKRAVKK